MVQSCADSADSGLIAAEEACPCGVVVLAPLLTLPRRLPSLRAGVFRAGNRRFYLAPRATNEIKIRLELGNPRELDLLVVDDAVKRLHQLRDLLLQASNVIDGCEWRVSRQGSRDHVGTAV